MKILWRREWQPTPVFSMGESSWTEEPGRLQSTGLQRVGHDWTTKHSTAHLLLVSSVTLKSLLTQLQVPYRLNGDNIFVKTKENTTHKARSTAPARHIILVVQSLSHVRLCNPMDCSVPRLLCPSPSPIVCSHSCPLIWWCHPTIFSSVYHQYMKY